MSFRASVTDKWAGTAAKAFTVPAGVVSTDSGLLVVVSAALTAACAISTPAGWTVKRAQGDFGSGSFAVYERTGLVAADTVTITKSDTGTPVVAAFVWDTNTHLFSGLGAATVRSTSTVTTNAPTHPETSGYTRSYAIAVGKTSSAMSCDAGTERAEIFYGAAAGQPYVSMVEYSGTKAARTFTAGTASSSGAGFQVAIIDTVVGPPSPETLTNSFEGNTEGQAITTGNSGSGSDDAFDFVHGTVVALAAAALNGSRGAKASLVSSQLSDVGWNRSGPVHFLRRYIDFAALPVTFNERIMWLSAAGVPQVECRLLADGNLIDVTVGGTQRMFVPVGGISPNTKYRVELHVNEDTDAAEMRLFLAHSTTILASAAWSGAIPACDSVSFGIRNSANVNAFNFMDDVGWSNDDWVGPATFTNAAPTVDAGPDMFVEPWQLVQRTANAADDSGTVAVAWTQLTGTAVTLTGTGADLEFVAPASMSQQVLTFRATATDPGALTATDDLTVTVGYATCAVPHSGAWVPARIHTTLVGVS